MPPPVVAPRLRSGAVMVGLVVGLALLVLSPSFGRAQPTGNYRPPLPPDAIATGCYPLPGDARLDLAYQVRRDGDVATAAGERLLHGQYDLVDRAEAERLLVASFQDVGFTPSRRDDTAAASRTLTKGTERITITVTELPGTSAESIVRGEFVLDLPVVASARPDDPVCGDRAATKRWVQIPWWPGR